MLGIGEKFPSFSLKATVGIDKDPDKAFTEIGDLDLDAPPVRQPEALAV